MLREINFLQLSNVIVYFVNKFAYLLENLKIVINYNVYLCFDPMLMHALELNNSFLNTRFTFIQGHDMIANYLYIEQYTKFPFF